jgi:hypothetical protein
VLAISVVKDNKHCYVFQQYRIANIDVYLSCKGQQTLLCISAVKDNKYCCVYQQWTMLSTSAIKDNK